MSTVTAWWSAWKWIVILAVLLLASLAINVKQYAWRAAAKAEARAETLADTLATTAGIARDAGKDSAGLIAELERIAERARTTRTIYSKAAAERPLAAACAPGQARVDAINQSLGPTSPEHP